MKISEMLREGAAGDYKAVGLMLSRNTARLVMILKKGADPQTIKQLQAIGAKLTKDSKEVAAWVEGSTSGDVRVGNPPGTQAGAAAVFGPLISAKQGLKETKTDRTFTADEINRMMAKTMKDIGYKTVLW